MQIFAKQMRKKFEPHKYKHMKMNMFQKYVIRWNSSVKMTVIVTGNITLIRAI